MTRKIITLPNNTVTRMADNLEARLRGWHMANAGDHHAQNEITEALNELADLRAGAEDLQNKWVDEMDARFMAEYHRELADQMVDQMRKNGFTVGVELVAATMAVELDLSKENVQRVIEWMMGEPHADAPPASMREDLRRVVLEMDRWIASDRGESSDDIEEAL